MKYELNFRNNHGSDQELLEDMKFVATKLGQNKLTMSDYDENGKFSSTTIRTRFGTWNIALEKVGLEITVTQSATEKELFKNLEEVWIKLGKQPQKRDMRRPLSKYSERAYMTKFGSWKKGLETFIEFINYEIEKPEENSVEENSIEISNEAETVYKHKTKRQASERLKVLVLMRDGNKCRLCGLTLTGDDIHFDHIFPWSKGGETTLENIQILCSKHNLAKGNAEYPK